MNKNVGKCDVELDQTILKFQRHLDKVKSKYAVQNTKLSREVFISFASRYCSSATGVAHDHVSHDMCAVEVVLKRVCRVEPASAAKLSG